jgi:hypothetical protein
MTIVSAITLLPSAASGQGYQPPAGPTITPYLDYFNAPLSPLLDNYRMYVRPRADLRSSLRGLGTAVNQQNQRLDQLGNDFQQANTSEAAPTGTGSTFMNYSHYFSGNQQQAYSPQRSAYRGGGSGVAVGRGGRGAGAGGGGGFRGF